ncbi:hypothetical protein OS493_014775 [Desmophyllum pertusum]|uniref:Uncharacterized protein n=1 Tax=Desmophyllum pertusum TaxID=174260 RepID=A0A9X0CFF9_9CNID|nr:hypothetical protein OS493_014775 [Desmophyllum pertusum]
MGSQSQSDSSQLTTLIKSFSETPDRNEKLGYLKNLTSQVLPGLSLVEVEAKCFSRSYQRATSDIGGIIESLQAGDEGKSHDSLQTIQSLLQLVMSFMECLESCLGHVTQLSLTDELSIGHIHSLPSAVIQTVKATFKHCKDSEQVYGDFFHLVSQDLAMLFKKTYQLQKALMELLDKVQLSYHDTSDQDVKDITDVCHQLLEVCILIGDLDTSILVNTWKVLKKLVIKHKDHIKNHLEVERLICHLCASIESKLMRCIQLAPGKKDESCDDQKVTGNSCTGDDVALGKILKVIRFLVGHLAHLVKEFDGYYDKCLENIFHFLLVIQSNLPPSVSAPKIATSAVQGVKSALLIVVEPLLSVLVKNKNFANLITREALEVDEKHHFAHCCLLVSILSILPATTEEVFVHWVMPTNYTEEERRHSIMEAVFKSFRHCVVEICLPVFVDGVMSKGKPLSEVTFYEHVCTRMCSLVASTPATCFPAVERCLLEHVLQDDVLCALLASDVWCFMARWGSAELCAGHVLVLTQLLLKLPYTAEAAHSHLSPLIQRLTRLMAVEHQETLVTSFPPSKVENISAWCVFPLQDMSENVKKKAGRSLVPLCVKVCHSRTTTSQSLEDDDLLSCCLCCLRRVYSLPQAASYVPPVHHSATIGLINDLWSHCSQGNELVKRLNIKTWCELLDLSSTLLPLIQPEDYAKILCGLRSLLGKCPSLELRQAAAQFLGNAVVKTSLNNLSDRHWLVHQRAFQSVKAFAEVTRYTHVMGDCVPESLLPGLSDFLNQLPFRHTEFTGNITEFDKEFLKHQLEAARKNQCPDPSVLEEKEIEIPHMDTKGRSRDTSTDQSEEPEAKRFKRHQDSSCEGQGDALYNEAIRTMKIPLSTILDLRKQFVPSSGIIKQVEEMQTLLQDFLNKPT